MTGRRIDTGMIASASAHAIVLLWAAVSFAARPLDAPPTESMPVDIVSASEFSQMMAGKKTAEKKEAPKPLVEKKAEPRPVENQAAQVSEKPEIVTASTAAAPPPEAKVPTPKPAPREAKQEAPEKNEPAKKEPEKKQPDAEALKKAEDVLKKLKKQAKKEEAKPVPEKKPEPKKLAEKPPQQPDSKLNFDEISALIDKRQPRRLAATGDVINPTPAMGAARGSAPQLSQNEMDRLSARIRQCWNPPAGQPGAGDMTVVLEFQFNQDGTLAAPPRLVSRTTSAYHQVAAESALRAVQQCAPYSFLPIAKYEAWKHILATFDLEEWGRS